MWQSSHETERAQSEDFPNSSNTTTHIKQPRRLTGPVSPVNTMDMNSPYFQARKKPRTDNDSNSPNIQISSRLMSDSPLRNKKLDQVKSSLFNHHSSHSSHSFLPQDTNNNHNQNNNNNHIHHTNENQNDNTNIDNDDNENKTNNSNINNSTNDNVAVKQNNKVVNSYTPPPPVSFGLSPRKHLKKSSVFPRTPQIVRSNNHSNPILPESNNNNNLYRYQRPLVKTLFTQNHYTSDQHGSGSGSGSSAGSRPGSGSGSGGSNKMGKQSEVGPNSNSFELFDKISKNLEKLYSKPKPIPLKELKVNNSTDEINNNIQNQDITNTKDNTSSLDDKSVRINEDKAPSPVEPIHEYRSLFKESGQDNLIKAFVRSPSPQD